LPRIQPKLAISQPGDEYEREADRVAEQVMRMPTRAPKDERSVPDARSGPTIQRKCAQCEGEEKLQRRTQNPELGTQNDSFVPPIVHEVLRSPGQSLDEATRAFMEPRFGHDFSGMRLHTDARAAESARSLHALAYTIGGDVVFGPDEYAPRSRRGRKLLAHELAHVRQQRALSPASAVAVIDDPFSEREANDAARSFACNGRAPGPASHSVPRGIQRQTHAGVSETKPAISLDYAKAEKKNKKWAASIGWSARLAEVAGGRFAAWKTLWDASDYYAFADAVAGFQASARIPGSSVDGVLGPLSWSRIGGLGEAMAGIAGVTRSESTKLCYEASRERIQRGYARAMGSVFTLPKDANASVFNTILSSDLKSIRNAPVEYRGTGAAGAIVYAGMGSFVVADDIWKGKLKPGAALQVWRNQKALDLLRAGQIKGEGKNAGTMRSLTNDDADFFGTSAVFVRYTTDTFDTIEVRHFSSPLKWSKSDWAVWVAANANESSAAPPPALATDR
jgi:hypothetical protein